MACCRCIIGGGDLTLPSYMLERQREAERGREGAVLPIGPHYTSHLRPFSDSESELVLDPEPLELDSSSESSELELLLALSRDCLWEGMPFPSPSPLALDLGLPPLSLPLTSCGGGRGGAEYCQECW